MVEQIRIKRSGRPTLRYARIRMRDGSWQYAYGNRSAFIRRVPGGYEVERREIVNGIVSVDRQVQTRFPASACDIAREWVTG